jgi:hypothetical protein
MALREKRTSGFVDHFKRPSLSAKALPEMVFGRSPGVAD